MTDEEIADEAQRIRTEEAWPLWPILPVKNIHRYEPGWPDDEEVGIVWAGLSDSPFYVYLTTMFHLKAGVPLTEQFQDVRHLEFPTVEDGIRAGWIGD